eukprot:465475-Amphidinium_carterae.1
MSYDRVTTGPAYVQVRVARVLNDQSRNIRRPVEHGEPKSTAFCRFSTCCYHRDCNSTVRPLQFSPLQTQHDSARLCCQSCFVTVTVSFKFAMLSGRLDSIHVQLRSPKHCDLQRLAQ